MKSEIESMIENCPEQEGNGINDVIDEMRSYIRSDSRRCYFGILSAYNRSKKKRKLTISEIADACEVTPMTIKRVENLQNYPNIMTLLRMLQSVGLTLTVTELPIDDRE